MKKSVFVVLTNYYPKNYFGTYSSVLNARQAIETVLSNNIIFRAWEDCGDYRYTFTTYGGEQYWAEIVFDTIDTI